MQSDEPNHHLAHVKAWMKSTTGLPRERQVELFERALEALWQRAHRTLGEVTLTAIVDRVLYTASEHYPPVASLKVERTGIQFEAFRERESLLDDNLLDAIRLVLVELLTVLGNLTGEILTPALHAELSKITPTASTGSAAQSEPGNAVRNGKKTKP